MVRVAFVVAAASFALYVFGVLPAYVPLDSLPALWRLPLPEYLARSGAPVGLGLAAAARRARDYLNLAAVALFALDDPGVLSARDSVAPAPASRPGVVAQVAVLLAADVRAVLDFFAANPAH